VFKSTPEVASQVNQFRTWVAGSEQMAEKYTAAPTPVDFAGMKGKVRDAALVDSLEAMYKTASIPPEVHVWDEADKADKLAQIEAAKDRLSNTYAMIEETEKEIAYLKTTRSTRETSIGELKGVYPEVAAEVEQEIENRQWFKDTLAK